MPPLAIEVVDLVKDFRRSRAVDGVSFSVPAGQVCALLGPNGAGKTTTIHTLLGLITPTSGTVHVLGHDVTREREAAIRRTNFMASYGHFPWRMTVREALVVYCELYEVADPRAAIRRAVDAVGVAHLLDRKCQMLSSGQATLTQLAKALLNEPALLFLDEPTASLDPEHAVQVREALRDIVDRDGTTVLITSHDMREIEALADRVLFLSRGRLVADATVAELRDRYGVADMEGVFLEVARQGRRAVT